MRILVIGALFWLVFSASSAAQDACSALTKYGTFLRIMAVASEDRSVMAPRVRAQLGRVLDQISRRQLRNDLTQARAAHLLPVVWELVQSGQMAIRSGQIPNKSQVRTTLSQVDRALRGMCLREQDDSRNQAKGIDQAGLDLVGGGGGLRPFKNREYVNLMWLALALGGALAVVLLVDLARKVIYAMYYHRRLCRIQATLLIDGAAVPSVISILGRKGAMLLPNDSTEVKAIRAVAGKVAVAVRVGDIVVPSTIFLMKEKSCHVFFQIPISVAMHGEMLGLSQVTPSYDKPPKFRRNVTQEYLFTPRPAYRKLAGLPDQTDRDDAWAKA